MLMDWNTLFQFVGTAGNVTKQLSADHTRLTLPNIKQSGVVTCMAANPFGQVQASSSVIYIPGMWLCIQ